MNSKQIFTALSKNKYTANYFDGVYSLDTLVDIKKRPKLIICNTDPSNKPGKHWILFFFKDENNVDFFDSLGNNLEKYGDEFVEFVNKFALKLHQSKIRIQPPKTSLCGHYCLLYSYYRCKGESMNNVLKILSSTEHVKREIKKYFNICKDSNCILLQKCSKM